MKMKPVNLSDDFLAYINARLSQYNCRVGILQNKLHYRPLQSTHQQKFQGKWVNFKHNWVPYNYAGLRLWRQGNKQDGTLYSVAKNLNNYIDWLQRPFRLSSNREVLSVIQLVIDGLNGVEVKQRILNAVQAVVRNPLLRSEYGKNSEKWAKYKMFNKLGFFTGQFFKNIKAEFDVSSKTR